MLRPSHGAASGADASRPRRARRAALVLAALAAPLLAGRTLAQAAPAVAPGTSASASSARPTPSASVSAATSATLAPTSSIAPKSSIAPASSASLAASPVAYAPAPSAKPVDTGVTAAPANGDPTIPSVLTIDGALRIFRERGYDLLIADAAVLGAEGDEIAAGAVINPSINGSVSKVFTYSPSTIDSCGGCSSTGFSFGVTDNGALVDVFIGKRPLRLKVARRALEIARESKEDTRRVLELQLKSSLAQLAAAQEALALAKEVAGTQNESYEISKAKYPRVINEGDLARMQTAKLEADQQVDMAIQNERVNRASVAFLLGVRGTVTPFSADPTILKYSTPAKLASATEEGLLRQAMENRPDVRIATMQIERSESAIDLARRSRWPDIALSLQYSQIGTGNAALSPPTVTFGVSLPLPLFYNQRGEIKRAQADYAANTVFKKKAEAQVVSDVLQAWTTFETSKLTVERMETGGLLESAKKARDITQIQFNAGQTTLLDYLDATRTYIGTNVEYVNDRLAYWTAVFQLEAAVGVELR